MAADKSEVVIARAEWPVKVALHAAAQREMRSLADMGEVTVIACCKRDGYPRQSVLRSALAGHRAKVRVF